MVDFTVAIPTYNGEHRLPEVLQRLQTQIEIDSLDWEILVVDNNSQDGTSTVVRSFQAEFQNKSCSIRYYLETQQGASYARQRAIQEAKSDLIGFLDDDNLPDERWIVAAYQFAQTHPQAGAYGSRIAASYEVEPPAHFKRIQAFLAITDRGSQPRLYEPHKKLLPPSAGLVIRKQAWIENVPQQTLFNRFRFKRSDGNDCSEDLEALSYIQQSNWEIWYNPAMQVTHKIPASRLEKHYLTPLFRSIGLSRSVTRLIGVKPWQWLFVVAAHMLNDLCKIMTHLVKYQTQIKTDLVAACELELYIGSLLSPIYLFYLWGIAHFKGNN